MKLFEGDHFNWENNLVLQSLNQDGIMKWSTFVRMTYMDIDNLEFTDNKGSLCHFHPGGGRCSRHLFHFTMIHATRSRGTWTQNTLLIRCLSTTPSVTSQWLAMQRCHGLMMERPRNLIVKSPKWYHMHSTSYVGVPEFTKDNRWEDFGRHMPSSSLPLGSVTSLIHSTPY
jgi:hypothetical protein